MATSQLRDKLVDSIEDAHAMEANVLRMLDSMIGTTNDGQVKKMLEHHKDETKEQIQRLEDRLKSYGHSAAPQKDAPMVAAALLKGLADRARSDKPAMNARDGFTTEHLEIATYELLERLASRAGDARTAAVARRNRKQEEQMAKKISSNWDKFVELTLKEEGVSS